MKITATLLLFFCHSWLQGQSYMTVGYSLGSPQQAMNTHINHLHSLTTGIYFTIPQLDKRVQLGADFGWGMYANTTKEQTFTFRDGSTTTTSVNYTSNVLQGAISARVMLLKNKAITPYFSGKAGYASFYSNIFIEDPHEGGCHPLDQKNIIRDGTVFGGYGGGLQLDWSVFNPKSPRKRSYIDLRVLNTRGGKVDYINTKKLIDATAPPPAGGDGKALTVKFINATTNEIHEHQVAEVYRTPMRMLEYRLSWVFVLD